MDTTVLNGVCIALISFVMLNVCYAIPVDSDDIAEYEPQVDNSIYTETCVLCFAFQHAGACELCNLNFPDTEEDQSLTKRSGNSYYHPFLRGGYPKKSYYYNPLLRGSGYKKSYPAKPQIYHPFLRGGFGGYPSSG